MRLFRHSWWQHLDYRVKVATTQENKTSNPRHPSVDFYHSPVAVWVNSAPQPKRWGFRAHRGSKAWSSSGCILSARQPIPGKNFTTKNFFDQFCHQCTATPAPSQGLPPRFLTRILVKPSPKQHHQHRDGGWVPGHCYSMPCMKIPAINQVIIIKHVVAVATYRLCRLWRWVKMSWIHYLLSDHDMTQCWHPISNAGHIAQIRILKDPWRPPIRHWQNVR